MLAGQALQVIPALQQSLKDPSPFVRGNSAWALGRFGPLATNAIADLERSSADPNADVSAQSIKSLRLIQGVDSHL